MTVVMKSKGTHTLLVGWSVGTRLAAVAVVVLDVFYSNHRIGNHLRRP